MTYPILTPAQLGYLAGFIDGDGHIGLVRRKCSWKKHSERTHYIRPIMQIGQKDVLPLEYIRQLVGSGNLGKHGKRPYYNLRFDTGTLRWLLPALIPHLVLKQPQARIVLDFINRCKYQGKELTDQEMSDREDLRAQIEVLNSGNDNMRKAA